MRNAKLHSLQEVGDSSPTSMDLDQVVKLYNPCVCVGSGKGRRDAVQGERSWGCERHDVIVVRRRCCAVVGKVLSSLTAHRSSYVPARPLPTNSLKLTRDMARWSCQSESLSGGCGAAWTLTWERRDGIGDGGMGVVVMGCAGKRGGVPRSFTCLWVAHLEEGRSICLTTDRVLVAF